MRCAWAALRVAWLNQRSFTSITSVAAAQAPVGAYTPITKALWLERLAGGHGAALQTESGELQPPKTLVYSFGASDGEAYVLKETYRNPWGSIRLGRLLEDLDSLAGSIAWQHCRQPDQQGAAAAPLDPTQGAPSAQPLLVTASVDEISTQHPITLDADMLMQGQVVWTGSSSLDIQMQVLQPTKHKEPSLTALFSFVQLDPVSLRPSPVRPLLPTSPHQRHVWQQRQSLAEQRKKARQEAAAAGGTTPVSAEARAFCAPLVAEYRRLKEMPALTSGAAGVPMAATSLENAFVCQPQQRNMHGRIFGGFLMRRAFELAFATTYTFAGCRPEFASCEEVTFRCPVDVGDLLRFRSLVLHTVPNQGLVCVGVEATVSRPETGYFQSTNNFTYVFKVQPRGSALRRVLPGNEEEALRAWACHLRLAEKAERSQAAQHPA
ncbi:HotDog domain-containing protein [Haematococcus lacustris]